MNDNNEFKKFGMSAQEAAEALDAIGPALRELYEWLLQAEREMALHSYIPGVPETYIHIPDPTPPPPPTPADSGSDTGEADVGSDGMG